MITTLESWDFVLIDGAFNYLPVSLPCVTAAVCKGKSPFGKCQTVDNVSIIKKFSLLTRAKESAGTALDLEEQSEANSKYHAVFARQIPFGDNCRH